MVKHGSAQTVSGACGLFPAAGAWRQNEHRIDHYISHEKHIYKYKLTHISPPKDTAMVSNGTKLLNIYMYIYRSDYGMSHELILHVVQETLSIPHWERDTFVRALVQRELKDDGWRKLLNMLPWKKPRTSNKHKHPTGANPAERRANSPAVRGNLRHRRGAVYVHLCVQTPCRHPSELQRRRAHKASWRTQNSRTVL